MNTPLYRIAFIGCGRRAHEHAAGVKADGRCEVVALSDLSTESSERLNAEFGFTGNIYTDHKEMLAKEKPDVVLICLWTPLHLPVFRDCAEAGVKAVLCEKPMSATWGECQEMGRIAEANGCQLTFSLQRRFAKGNQTVRRLIKEGKIGQVVRMDLYSPPNLLDCGIHTFDQAISYMDETPAKWVLGAVDTTETYNWFNVPSECGASGRIVFANGVQANLVSGEMDTWDPAAGDATKTWAGVRVHGTEGFIEVMWDGQIIRGVNYKDPSWTPEMELSSMTDQMEGYVRHAIDCLGTGEEPEVSHAKALRASEIIFAVYESVRRNARVELPLADVTDSPFITMLENGQFAK
ncbi:Gfo/Idh/MocA family oxidoreductase [Paenibacillus rhizovicinus]|uniref:Gfo/Idh/MocA family oxidoreductase n=1 Tax=Paenibacillus rhizovicinus TaxID=2704463 RepID=A0A6C0NY77_9BACL|nr:Gfo/Idh/MocA family oxidoreductase [Paenibacillus rhizovicinus]QHW31148.1 Gfo/Idh/MocA family oxidoreductase [Paenibacillus rhizovicinus]